MNKKVKMNKITGNLFKKDKKALSTIVATLLVLLLCIIAIAIIYFTIQNLINKTRYSPQFTCSEIKLENPIEIISSCYNLETNNIEITVTNSFSRINVEKIGFLIKSSTDYSEYACGEIGCGCIVPEKGNTKTYFFEFSPEQIIQQEKLVLKVNNCILTEKQIKKC